MSSANVGDNAPIRTGDARQLGDLSSVVHAHFYDSKLMFRLKTKQLQRQAETIVEISLRFEDTKTRAECCGNGVFRRRLACAAGNRSHQPAPMAANMRSQRLQCLERIFDNQQRRRKHRVGKSRDTLAGDDGCDRATLQSREQKIMPVESFPANRKKQLACGDGARVDRVPLRYKRTGSRSAGRSLQPRAATQRRFCKC